MHDLNGMGWGMGWWWIIGIIIIVAIVWMVTKTMNKTSNGNTSFGKTPLDILKERYARGEIGKEEFEKRRKSLM